jgi:hypothetical protein
MRHRVPAGLVRAVFQDRAHDRTVNGSGKWAAPDHAVGGPDLLEQCDVGRDRPLGVVVEDVEDVM